MESLSTWSVTIAESLSPVVTSVGTSHRRLANLSGLTTVTGRSAGQARTCPRGCEGDAGQHDCDRNSRRHSRGTPAPPCRGALPAEQLPSRRRGSEGVSALPSIVSNRRF